MNIALWGYGKYGQDLEYVFNNNSSCGYILTAVFDSNFEQINASGSSKRIILDPSTIKEHYNSGLFESVVITIFNPIIRQQIGQELISQNIPVLSPDNSILLHPSKDFSQTEADFEIHQVGYKLYALGAAHISFMPRSDMSFISDERGYVSTSGWRWYQDNVYSFARQFFPPEGKEPVFLKGQWCMPAGFFGKNYWHFLFETLDRIALIEEAGYKGGYIFPKTDFASELLGLMQIDQNRILWFEELDKYQVYQPEILICIEAEGFWQVNSAPVLDRVAKKLLENMGESDKEYPKKVYVKRIGTRKLIVPDEFFKDHGFTVIIPEELSVRQQIRYFNNADIVICPHGANSANSLFMRPGSVFVETFPEEYVNPCCSELLSYKKIISLMLAGKSNEQQQSKEPLHRDYTIDENQLEQTIAKAEKTLQKTDKIP